MPYDYFTPVEQPNVLAQIGQLTQLQGVMDSRRKKAQLAQFLQTGDVNSVEGLRQAYQIDPDFGIKLSKMQGEQGMAKNRMAKMATDMEKTETETKQMKAKVLAGVAGLTVKQFDALPPEQQTPQNYANLFRNSRTGILQIGMHSPDEIPEFMPLEELRAVQGGNFSPSQQATAELGQQTFKQRGEYQQQEQGLRERQFAQQSDIENQGLRIRRQGLANTEAYRNKLLSKQGTGNGKSKLSAFDQKVEALKQFPPGSPEFEAASISLGMKPRAQGMGTPIYNEKGEITSYLGGSGGRPLTEQQGKYVIHGEEMSRASQGMDALQVEETDPKSGKKTKFDPTSVVDAANVEMASHPLTYPMASEKGQMQEAYNKSFALALSYGRSMATFRPDELKAAYDTFLERLGDKPEQKKAKKAARDTVTKAFLAGDPRLPQIVAKLTGGIDFTAGGGPPVATPQAMGGSNPPAPTGAGAGVPGSMQMAPGGPPVGAAPPPGGEHPQDMFQRLMTGGR